MHSLIRKEEEQHFHLKGVGDGRKTSKLLSPIRYIAASTDAMLHVHPMELGDSITYAPSVRDTDSGKSVNVGKKNCITTLCVNTCVLYSRQREPSVHMLTCGQACTTSGHRTLS